MPAPAEIFREIHRLRKNLKDLQTKIEQTPKQLKTQQAAVARQDEALKQAQDGLKHLKVTMHEKEVSLKAVMQKLEKYERQLNEIMSKKEFEALKHEIAHARQEKDKLETEILEAMGEIEERAGKLPDMERTLQQTRAETAKFEAESHSRLAGFTQQIEEVKKQLAEIEATLPDDIRPHYLRISALKGEDALAAVAGRTCSACYTEITAQNYNDLARSLFVPCKSCGRILYMPQ